MDYLKDTFEKDSTTEIAGGVTLSRFIGVKAADNTTVTGGMCGNAQNGLPLLFAGGDTATANLVERASNAMFNVKNDGSGQWGIFQVLNNKVIIYDEQGDRASVVISNRKVSEESNKENSFKSVTLFNKQSAVWNTDNLLTEPGVYPSVEKKTETLNLTYPLEMEAGFWRVSINTSLNAYISKMVTSTATIPYGTVLGTVRLYVQVLLYIEDASTGEKEVITISRKDVDMGDDFSLTNSMSDNFYIKYANNFNFDTAKKVYLMVFCEGLCSTLNSSSYPVQSKYTWRVIFDKIGGNSIISAVKTVNQNIIGSDGISIVYDGDEFFEVTKKDNGRIKILATLHTPADVNSLEKGQLYCDANGFVKVKQ